MLYGVFGLLALILFVRLSYLQVAINHFLTRQGDARTVREVTIPSYRGLITDRRGTPIAVSSPVDSVWVNPKMFEATEEQMIDLSLHLGIEVNDLHNKIEKYANKSFLYLKRGLTPAKAKTIDRMGVKGVHLQREFRRFYPAGPVTAQLIGFTDIDDKGQSGLELSFDEYLRPIASKKTVIEDRMGHWIEDLDNKSTRKQGENLTLSIDLRLQTLAYNVLNRTVKELKAKSGTIIMMDTRTSEVLAMVSAPAFNPNVFSQRKGESVRNRAMTDQIEPGSVVKTFSMVSLLEHSDLNIDDEIDTSPGVYPIGEHSVRDVVNYGKIRVDDVLIKSSNVGLSKLITERPSHELLDTFSAFGLGSEKSYVFPGEATGWLPDPTPDPFMNSTFSFGYSLMVTPIQLVHAYATLASKGAKKPISLLKVEEPSRLKIEQIISEKTCEDVIEMLSKVMSKTGTGRRGRIEGYLTAGKTGTARLVGENGYDKDRHRALFIGFTPVHKPRLATLILIEEPREDQSRYYGGKAAAPVYAEVVKGALHILNVPPDNANT